MLTVVITSADGKTLQYVSVPYVEVQASAPASNIATAVRVVMPQGMFTVEDGSNVVIYSPDHNMREEYLVRFEAGAIS